MGVDINRCTIIKKASVEMYRLSLQTIIFYDIVYVLAVPSPGHFILKFTDRLSIIAIKHVLDRINRT